MFVRAGNDAGGRFKVERAYADLYFGRTTLRLGQFYVPGDAELDPSPQNTLGTDYSPTGYTFDVDASQGWLVLLAIGFQTRHARIERLLRRMRMSDRF